jgi:[FeFe] hydrogenase (group B1/B3)
MLDGSIYMRRELTIRVVRAFYDGTLEKMLDQLPIELRPQKGRPSSRCCIYHDRAVIKYRLMSLLGFSCDDETDETRSLASYCQEAFQRDLKQRNPEKPPLSVCNAACSSCPPARVVVTGNCRGCFARPCMYSCPKGAISIVNQVSTIDASKCIKCGKCVSVCPFHAIVKTAVPCEEACPTGAIHKNEEGLAEIDFEKCIFCGNCFSKCPFSAIQEQSQLIDILCDLKEGKKVVAMVAPAATEQFMGTIEQLFTAISKIGFTDVVEVALGAEMTTKHETEEFMEKMQEGAPLMTTSCCPAYLEMVNKLAPEIKPYVSSTPSPMVYTAELVREKYPDAKVVFIGPCVAKRLEAARKGIDYVLNFEELGSILAGLHIDIMSCEPWKLPRPAIVTARNFAKSCGVTEAVIHEAGGGFPEGFKLNAKAINGIDRKTPMLLKMYAAGKVPANFLEVMCCPGGCINGPCSLKK